jgi:hypothetical protein
MKLAGFTSPSEQNWLTRYWTRLLQTSGKPSCFEVFCCFWNTEFMFKFFKPLCFWIYALFICSIIFVKTFQWINVFPSSLAALSISFLCSLSGRLEIQSLVAYDWRILSRRKFMRPYLFPLYVHFPEDWKSSLLSHMIEESY